MRIINDLNFKRQAEELGISVWYTPSFLFLMLGVLIIFIMTGVSQISKYYDSPEFIILAECITVIIIFIVGNSVIREIEQIARVNKMKSEFISVASHQLRTPLSAVRWQVELISKKFSQGLNEKQKQGIDNIGGLSLRMTKLVNDLLDVARIDQGRFILKKDPVNLTEIIEEAMKDVSVLAKSRNVEIKFNNYGEEKCILGDRNRLFVVVENLLSNSIKYIFKKGVISIDLYDKEGFLVFKIKDNGVGIPARQQRNVFEKFFRSDNVVKYQTEGTGLGLYIAKNIVEQSGGKIWFESKENYGTTFYFSIPICEEIKK